jgi:hypothetical protein
MALKHKGHCHLKGDLFKMGLMNSPTCYRYTEKNESATHIPCDYEAIAYLRFRHLGHYFMEPGNYQDAPISKILTTLLSKYRIVEGLKQRGMHNRSLTVAVQGRLGLPLMHACIHSFMALKKWQRKSHLRLLATMIDWCDAISNLLRKTHRTSS